jgi:GWxTD domain-containing protein
MTWRRLFIFLLFSVLFLIGLPAASQPLTREWKSWLDEVGPIMTKRELSVFKSLQTEEDRKRFQQMFWKARDTTPGTPQNETMIEYYARKGYAEAHYDGARTDRGRIYVLLGKPAEVQNFSGSEKVVDCELWLYQNEGRRGLPPMLYLLFYRRDNIGDYVLFYPGLNSNLEILSTSYMRGSVGKAQAYRIISSSFPELAKASLSVIPEEANAAFAGTPNSSANVIAQIHNLPEKEAEKGYLRNFSAVDGTVDVSYSAREIAAKAAFWLTEENGIRFLNYSLLPDVIRTVKNPDGFQTAHLVFHLRVEDAAGRTIYQREKEIRLKLDEARKRAMEERKFVFNDLAPIIEGDFDASLTLTNRTTEEFSVHEERIRTGPGAMPAVVGYEVKEKNAGSFVPLSLGDYKVLSDPRAIYGPGETLATILISDKAPRVILVPRDTGLEAVEIKAAFQRGSLFVFRRPLKDVRPGNYDLVVDREGAEVFRKTVSILSFDVPKPIEFESVEPLSSKDDYTFILGQEYLNAGDAARALEHFRSLPERLWNSGSIPVIARALYLTKDFAGVLELLEKDGVERTYPVLLLLGNSCLELKKLDQAAVYFEQVRKYGDTPENNRTLGAIYFSLGDKEKAKTYWDRADALEKKRGETKPGEIKEPS